MLYENHGTDDRFGPFIPFRYLQNNETDLQHESESEKNESKSESE